MTDPKITQTLEGLCYQVAFDSDFTVTGNNSTDLQELLAKVADRRVRVTIETIELPSLPSPKVEKVKKAVPLESSA
jgi:hypothetical protein